MDFDLRILIADDQKEFCEIFKDLLKSLNCKVFCTSNPDEVVETIFENEIHLVFLDKRFPSDGRGIELLKEIKKVQPQTEVVMMTSFPDATSSHEALQESASGYFIKTDDYETLLETTKFLIEKIKKNRKEENEIKNLEIAKKTLSDWNTELIKKLKKLEGKS
ncbi:MAG: response regulator [Candidatus Riflebacteria bacterium]|nr:response regulator [Candidatus Riflebacteria bacterium]